jgi:chromosome segregation ATPase
MSDINHGNIKNPVAGVATGSAHADAVMSKIQSQMGSIKDIIATVRALLREMEGLKNSRPKRPDTKGMKAEDIAKAMANFERAMGQWMKQVQRLNGQIQAAQQKLHDADAVLQKMQNIELPAAEARDRDDMKRQLEEQQKALKSAAESFAASTDDRVDKNAENDASGRRYEIRVVMVKRETKHGVRDFVNLAIGAAGAKPRHDAQEITGSRLPPTPASGIPTEG